MPSKPWADRGSRHERGYGYAWQKLRQVILRRDMHLCQPCWCAGRATPAEQVDHIKPKAQGGTDEQGNLQAICAECHAAKSERERLEALGVRPRQAIGLDGWPVEAG